MFILLNMFQFECYEMINENKDVSFNEMNKQFDERPRFHVKTSTTGKRKLMLTS